MTSKDMLEFCWGNLKRRKTRTILSVVGVVVGVCAIIVMVSIGFGLSESFQEQIEGYGDLHLVTVNNYGGGTSPTGQKVYLNDSTLSKIEMLDGVTAVTPVVEEYVTIGIGHKVASVSLYGIKPDVMEKMNYQLEEGRLLNSSDKNALVFGKGVLSWFYDPRRQSGSNWNAQGSDIDVITKNIVITGDYDYGTNREGTGDYKYEQFDAEGVGLLASENDEKAYRVYMNIETVEKIRESIRKSRGENTALSGGQKSYDTAIVYVDDISKVKGVCNAIKDDYGFSTWSLNDMLENMNQTANTIQLVLGGIGAVSLLVAAIGIANTMVMSVFERTREIGVMKVIGASLSDIGRMFLLEAGMIGFLGGAAGIVLSYGLSYLMNRFLSDMIAGFIGGGGGTVSVIPLWVTAGSLLFATLVGVISGYYPARRAMNLSALDGLKNE